MATRNVRNLTASGIRPTPTISLNGTDREELQERLSTAKNALREALEALNQTAPNQRDFLGRDQDYEEAVEIQRQRSEVLASILSSVEEEEFNVSVA